MKITDFFVSGFGIFSGSGARLSGGLTVFQGENESGKTTLMNFFRRLLFSRGKNGRGKTNLYEPQRGGQHGGSARIRMEDGREYILSVEGQKNYIAPADGGPAAELSPDFFSISREVYESVFAMGLGEMQSLDPLNSSDTSSPSTTWRSLIPVFWYILSSVHVPNSSTRALLSTTFGGR